MPSITETFEPILGPVGRTLGFDPREFSEQVAPEVLATIIELPINLVMPKLGQKVASLLIGVGTMAYAALANPPAGLRKDLIHLGAHFLNDVVDPDWDDMEAFVGDLIALKTGIAAGNNDMIIRSLIYTPAEIEYRLNRVRALVEKLVETEQDTTEKKDDVEALKKELQELRKKLAGVSANVGISPPKKGPEEEEKIESDWVSLTV